ncbi:MULTISPECIES: ABC transporter ATP-binding protein [Cohaesibacter]|uniref:ABC transporter ATP-binding protein n=1 Tax=Cohaesibacter TaxID=655352 RepID=UPI000DE84F90|nr:MULTISPECIES: ABC transporter ATP-binding protein [Cohaesibacter]TLP49305.1 ABC transporter ATP-binding protein [Cohaesibacter sp. CAU 1516]
MAKLSFDRVSKRFGDVDVLKAVSLDIEDGELIALLGPSGCGKTTMLRLAAGFEHPNAGIIAKDNAILSNESIHLAPEERNMGIVFQSYALWPHMSVADNIAYPLKIRRVSQRELDETLSMALDVVSLTNFADASPSTLSGGQRQRVALARCLVMNPDAVLLDEPLANLDAHLREVMQQTFMDFHARTQTTMVYVTHDQAEAMAMADRIAVMFDGEIAQVARPQDLYQQPANERVARFIGQSAILTGHLEGCGGGATRDVVVNGQVFKVRQSESVNGLADASAVRVCVRPEHVQLHQECGLAARVSGCSYLGERYRLHLQMPDETSVAAYANQPAKIGEMLRFTFTDGWAFGQAVA